MSRRPGTTLVASCDNVDERTGLACPGHLRFQWGQVQASCDACGGYCGIAVATWEQVKPAERTAETGVCRHDRLADSCLDCVHDQLARGDSLAAAAERLLAALVGSATQWEHITERTALLAASRAWRAGR